VKRPVFRKKYEGIKKNRLPPVVNETLAEEREEWEGSNVRQEIFNPHVIIY
jgi:hypothetical protein